MCWRRYCRSVAFHRGICQDEYMTALRSTIRFQSIIHEKSIEKTKEVDQVLALTKHRSVCVLQSVWRGIIVRQQMLLWTASAWMIQIQWRKFSKKIRQHSKEQQYQLTMSRITRIQSVLKTSAADLHSRKLLATAEYRAAVVIQSIARMWSSKKSFEMERYARANLGFTYFQARARGVLVRSRNERRKMRIWIMMFQAKTGISRRWRRKTR